MLVAKFATALSFKAETMSTLVECLSICVAICDLALEVRLIFCPDVHLSILLRLIIDADC